MMIQTFFARRKSDYMDSSQKGEMGQIYRLSLERKNKSKIWTFFGKKEQVKDMNSPCKGGTGRRHEPSLDKGGAGSVVAKDQVDQSTAAKDQVDRSVAAKDQE